MAPDFGWLRAVGLERPTPTHHLARNDLNGNDTVL